MVVFLRGGGDGYRAVVAPDRMVCCISQNAQIM
jgi:hypothetical protein